MPNPLAAIIAAAIIGAVVVGLNVGFRLRRARMTSEQRADADEPDPDQNVW